MKQGGVIAFGLVGSMLVAGRASQINPARPLSAVEITLKEHYASEFNELIERPAIHRDSTGGGCKGREPYLTSTAYLRTSPTTARLLYIYTNFDASAVVRIADVARVVIPAGTFRVLTVIVAHPGTVRNSDLSNWRLAQEKINKDHASVAKTGGLAAPIVSFDNTTVLVDPVDIANPREPSSVREAAERKGFAPASYQFVVSINLDPMRPEGGFAGADGFVYMGNYSKWQRPLTASEWINVANAVYHHEVSHHWGWPATHDWAPRCGVPPSERPPFMVPPILFGWEDVDGDRIPEILDPTPYGRTK